MSAAACRARPAAQPSTRRQPATGAAAAAASKVPAAAAVAARHTARNAASLSSRAAPHLSSTASNGAGMDKFQGTTSKALQINLDPNLYGSFAEIGAGQEVARWFFSVGAAAGTVAKSVSAYDMTISDSFYGACDRYVTRERLESMLEYEYVQTTLPLKSARGANTCFFSFADTVVAKAFGRQNECHGWMGVKYQTEPGKPPSRVMLHLRLLDGTATEQQEALGVFGVNFLHTVFYKWQAISESVESCKGQLGALLDELTDANGNNRIEVDLMNVDGPDFTMVDNRVLALQLVDMRLTNAVLFNQSGEVTIPSDYLRKNAVLVQRGNFRPPTVLNNDLIEGAAAKMFCGNEKSVDEDGCILLQGARVLMELTIKDLRDSGDGLDWTEDYHAYLKRSSRDFLDRVDAISAMGYPCLVSNYFEYFELAEYLQRATKEQIVICMGVPAVKELFNASYYDHLPGGIMENFGRLVTQGLKIYVYPQLLSDGELITADNLRLAGRTQSLYDYLYQTGNIVAIDEYNLDIMKATRGRPASYMVLKYIRDGNDEWEQMVTPAVRKVIKSQGLFGYQS